MKRPLPEQVVEAALQANGSIPLGTWISWCLDDSEILVLCRRFDLKPKGGFRIEKSPPGTRLTLLSTAFLEREDVRKATAELLCGGPARSAGRDEAPAPTDGDAAALLKLKREEADGLRSDLQKARKTAESQRSRIHELERSGEKSHEEHSRLRAEASALRRSLEERETAFRHREEGEEQQRLETSRRQLEQIAFQLDGERRRRAELVARIAELELEVEELRARVPDWKTRKPAEPERDLPSGDLLVPRFSDEFYRSIKDRDRRVIRSAFGAILTLCLRGPAYPSLETKSLQGFDGLWSIRSGLKHRIYFSMPRVGEFQVERLEDREDQGTYLRKKKDR